MAALADELFEQSGRVAMSLRDVGSGARSRQSVGKPDDAPPPESLL